MGSLFFSFLADGRRTKRRRFGDKEEKVGSDLGLIINKRPSSIVCWPWLIKQHQLAFGNEAQDNIALVSFFFFFNALII